MQTQSDADRFQPLLFSVLIRPDWYKESDGEVREIKCIPPASETADKSTNSYCGGSHDTSRVKIVAR
jgi:hypothetical protein